MSEVGAQLLEEDWACTIAVLVEQCSVCYYYFYLLLNKSNNYGYVYYVYAAIQPLDYLHYFSGRVTKPGTVSVILCNVNKSSL